MGERRLRAWNVTIWVDSDLSEDEIRQKIEQIDLYGMQISIREVTGG